MQYPHMKAAYFIVHVTRYVTKTEKAAFEKAAKIQIYKNRTKKELTKHFYLVSLWWLKTDSNHRPAGYEPDALAS